MHPARIGLMFGVLVLSACGRAPSVESVLPDDPKRMTIRLQSPAFSDGGVVPKVYTCDGKNVSPPLTWSGVPESARSLALICDDPDAPMGVWTHWLIVDIPVTAKELPEGVEPKPEVTFVPGQEPALQGKNDFRKVGYGGPCPPGGTHHYVFRIYAVDFRWTPGSDVTRQRVLEALKGHILAEGRLTGLYSR
jgi:Raf kinase inhibitor-like YbhB/YbcL family protein